MNDKMKKFFDNDRFSALAGIKPIKVEPGYSLVKMEVTENHLNAVNIIQGGAIFTVADFAVATAASAYGQVTVGVSASVSYYKASQGKVLFAEAKEISPSKNISTYHVDVYDDNEESIAHVVITCYKKKQEIQFG